MRPTKIFKDLASGFAAKGIAVLRYEKRSRVFKSRIQHQKVFTVRDESIEDVPAAIAIACADSSIDSTQIYLLGHSFGGYLLPRIVKENPKVKGMIMLAANARNLEDLFVDQTAYVLQATKQSPDFTKHVMDSVTAIQSKIQKLTEASYNDSTLYFMAPPAYWVDLHNYKAISMASQLTQPMLFLYGLRDYQINSKDITPWQNGLKEKTNAEFKMYPKLNHFFIAGEGMSVPEEYEKQGNVDENVINDIAAWILGKAK
jgi:dienelactone hydrolase